MNKIIKGSKRFMSVLLMTILILSMSIPVVYSQAAPVSDIQNHWAKQEISTWITQGFIKGYPDGTFRPDSTITRAEFISLVNRVFAFSEKAAVPFTDVKENAWYYEEFAKAGKAGYLNGYEAGKIAPEGFITRQEVAVISAKVKSLPEASAEADSFADAAAIPANSKGFIGAVMKAKIMNGYPDGKFEPAKTITRAEAVITLNRLINIKGAVVIEAIKDKTIFTGVTYPITVKVQPADAKVTVQSSDTTIVEATYADSKIQLKGIKVGSATITVTGKSEGMSDCIITFKIQVVKASSGSGGGGSSGGGATTPTADENALTNAKAVGTDTTVVTGNYGFGVTKVEVIYNSVTVSATQKNGAFSYSIKPGLAAGTVVTVKGYRSNGLVDTDTATVVEIPPVEDDTMLTYVQAIGNIATSVTGNYASEVTKVEVIYNGLTKTAALNNDGTFSWSIFPGLANGTKVTVKGYAGSKLVDTDVVEVGVEAEKPYLSNVKATGTIATAVTGNYGKNVTKVEVIYNGLTKTAALDSNGTFSWSIFPGLAGGTTVTVKAYSGSEVVATVTIVTEGSVSEGSYLTNVTAIGTIATAVTGKYADTVTKVEVIYSGLTKEAALNDDGTFSWSIFPGLAAGSEVIVKAYVGELLVETETVHTPGAPAEVTYLNNVKAVGTIATAVTGEYDDSVTKVEVLYNSLTKTAMLNANGTFSWSIFPGLASGAQVTVKAYVGNDLKATLVVNVQ